MATGQCTQIGFPQFKTNKQLFAVQTNLDSQPFPIVFSTVRFSDLLLDLCSLEIQNLSKGLKKLKLLHSYFRYNQITVGNLSSVRTKKGENGENVSLAQEGLWARFLNSGFHLDRLIRNLLRVYCGCFAGRREAVGNPLANRGFRGNG